MSYPSDDIKDLMRNMTEERTPYKKMKEDGEEGAPVSDEPIPTPIDEKEFMEKLRSTFGSAYGKRFSLYTLLTAAIMKGSDEDTEEFADSLAQDMEQRGWVGTSESKKVVKEDLDIEITDGEEAVQCINAHINDLQHIVQALEDDPGAIDSGEKMKILGEECSKIDNAIDSIQNNVLGIHPTPHESKLREAGKKEKDDEKEEKPKDAPKDKESDEPGESPHQEVDTDYSIEQFEHDGRAVEMGLGEDDVDSEQLAMGVEVEMEHTTNATVAKKIAMDHLAEISNYYTHLKAMELEAKGEDLANNSFK